MQDMTFDILSRQKKEMKKMKFRKRIGNKDAF